MLSIDAQEKKALKGRGFILTRDGEHFIARVVSGNGVYTNEEMSAIVKAAADYGSGDLALTSRMTIEVQGIPYENIEPFNEAMEAAGLEVGGTGARVRPVVCCKGSVCVHGLTDTQDMAREIHETFYLGWHHVALPHKFKIGIGGCINNCVKPLLNDFGVMGRKVGSHVVAVGGIWGRQQRMSTQLPGLYSREEVLVLLEKCILLYRELGYAGERLGRCIDRVGEEEFIARLLSDDVLARKDEILAAPLKTRS